MTTSRPPQSATGTSRRTKRIPRAQEYSPKTKRHATQLQGVYERRTTRPGVGPDVGYDITYKVQGHKRWEKVGWRSEGYSPELARDVRNARIKAIRHGEELPRQKAKAPTLATLAEKYLKWSSENTNRNGIGDKSRYENHLQPRFADTRLDAISSLDLERLKADMAKDGLAPKSIAHVLALLRAMFNKAVDWGLYQGANPVRKVKMPVIQNERDRFLSIDEADTLLRELKRNPRFPKEYRELKDPRLHDIALFSLHTGARAGEAFNLKGQDVDLARNLATLRDTKNTLTRHVPLTAAAAAMLKRRLPADANPTAYVFTDDDGQQITEVSNAFDRAVTRLGFNANVTDRRLKVVFHTLRHTFASWHAIQGTDLLTIARLMGHKDVKMCQRYAHLSPEHMQRATKAFEAALNGHAKVVPIERKGEMA